MKKTEPRMNANEHEWEPLTDKDLEAIEARCEAAIKAGNNLKSQFSPLKQLALEGDLDAAAKIETLIDLALKDRSDIPALVNHIRELKALNKTAVDYAAMTENENEKLKKEKTALLDALDLSIAYHYSGHTIPHDDYKEIQEVYDGAKGDQPTALKQAEKTQFGRNILSRGRNEDNGTE